MVRKANTDNRVPTQPESAEQTPTVPVDPTAYIGGFKDAQEVINNAPETTTPKTGGQDEVKTRRTRGPNKPKAPAEPSPLETDARYNKAIANMTTGALEKLIAAPFEVWAYLSHDPMLALTQTEKDEWADFMYVVGKKITQANIDPASPKFLIAYGLFLSVKQAGTKFVMHRIALGDTVPAPVMEALGVAKQNAAA